MDATRNDPLVGRMLDGRYRVDARVAAGGMATVYRALDTRLDRTVALKVMHPGLAQDADFTRRFIQEAKAAARLSHPNVVNVFDQGTDGPVAYLAMEYVEGRTLRELLEDLRNLTPREAFGVLEPMLAALAAAHRAGFVHRDIKPENVLISDDGGIKLGDFGLARATSTTASAATGKVLVGTVAYLSPEQVERGESSPRSDVYAAGVVLYEMLTGRQPHAGATAVEVIYKHVHSDVPVPSLMVPGLAPALDTLVRAATVRDASQRPADAEALLTLVRRVRHSMTDAELDFGADLRLPPPPEPIDGNATSVFRTNEVLLPAHLAPLGLSSESMDDEQRRYREYDQDDQHDQEATALQPFAPIPDAPAGNGDGSGGAPAGAGRRGRGRRRPSRGVIVLVAVLLVAAGIGGAAWWYGSGRYSDVPAIINMSRADAEKRLKAQHLKWRYEERFSETVAAGAVFETDPGAGSSLLRGSTVTVRISLGPERYEVPQVANMPVQDAKEALKRANLAVGRETTIASPQAPGTVLSTRPTVGERLQRDSPVELVVSRGPDRQVPDLTGRTPEEATAALQAVGLTLVVDPVQVFSDTAPVGRVASQNPPVNATVANGTQVTVQISKGPDLVQVPNVVGQSVDQAKQTLSAAGFQPEAFTLPVIPGNVLRQDPPAGSMKKRGEKVSVWAF